MGGESDGSLQVVTVDDVTVEKHLHQDHPQHEAVSFEIRSDRENPVRLKLLDPIPDEFPVGFHPDFGGEYWTFTDQGAEFERVIVGGETYQTAYGVGNVSEAEESSLTVDPKVEISADIGAPIEPDWAADDSDGVDDGPFDGLGDLDLSIGDTPSFEPDHAITGSQDSTPPTGESKADDGTPPNADEPNIDSESGGVESSTGTGDKAEPFFDEIFEDDPDGEIGPLDADADHESTVDRPNTSAGLEGPASDLDPADLSEDELAGSIDDSSSDGDPPGDAVLGPSSQRSAIEETIEELETAASRLANSSDGKTDDIDELQELIRGFRDEMTAVQDSLETVENQSLNLATVFDDLEATIRTLEGTLDEQKGADQTDVSELYATISDVAEELSLIKSSLASNLETVYQQRDYLEELDTEVEQAVDATDTIMERTLSITQELGSIRDLLRANAQSLENLESDQAELRNTVTEFNDRFDELVDQIDGIQGDVETAMELIMGAMLADLTVHSPADIENLAPPERELLQTPGSLPPTLISGIGPSRARSLQSEIGITNVSELAVADEEQVSEIANTSVDEAERFISTAAALADL